MCTRYKKLYCIGNGNGKVVKIVMEMRAAKRKSGFRRKINRAKAAGQLVIIRFPSMYLFTLRLHIHVHTNTDTLFLFFSLSLSLCIWYVYVCASLPNSDGLYGMGANTNACHYRRLHNTHQRESFTHNRLSSDS